MLNCLIIIFAICLSQRRKQTMTFGEILKRRRVEMGLTQQQLAEKVFSTTTAISQFEHDKHLPKTDMIYSLAEVLNTPVEILLFVGSETILDVDLSNEFLASENTVKTFGYIPYKISLTDVAEHKYRSLKVWNPEYSLEQFMVDIIYPYIRNNPEETGNLVKLYGKREGSTTSVSMQETGKGRSILVPDILNATKDNQKNELILSKTVRKDISVSSNNTIVFSMPRTGKDRHILVPNILNLGTNMIITDAGGNLYKETCEELEQKGYQVKILNVTEDDRFGDDNHLIGYNPFIYLENDQDILELVEKLLAPWQEHGGNEKADIAKQKLQMFIEQMLDEYEKKDWSTYTLMQIVDEAYNMEQEKEAAGLVYTNIMAMLFIFKNEIFIKHMSDDFNIDEFLENEKWAIFIYINQFRQSTNIMNHIFLKTFMNKRLQRENNKKAVFIFDEFENFEKIEWITDMTSVSKNDTFLYVCNSLESLVAVYGKDIANLLMNQCDNLVCFRAHSIETCEYISRIGGLVPLDKPKRTLLGGRIYETPVFSSRDIATIKDGECLVLCRGSNAFMDKVYNHETI